MSQYGQPRRNVNLINDNEVEKQISSLGVFLRNTTIQASNKIQGKRSYNSGANVGFNVAIPTTETTIAGGLPANGINRLTFPPSSNTIAIASTSANDTSAGTGARTVRLNGLDSNYDEITEVLTLNGQTPVISSLSFLRFQGLLTLTLGTSEFNEGNIYIGDSGDTFSGGVPDTAICYTMAIGSNIARCAVYTVPNNMDYYLLRFNINTDATESKPAGMKIYNQRLGQPNRLLSNNIFSSSSNFETPSAIIKPFGTDIEITGENLGAGTIDFQVFTHFVLQDNS